MMNRQQPQQRPTNTMQLEVSAPVRGGGNGDNLPALQPLTKSRTTSLKRSSGSALSMMSMYLGGIAGGFSQSDIPEMKRDPDVKLGLEYLITPILNAVVKVVGTSPEVSDAQAAFDRFWQHDLERFKDMFCWGHCAAEVKYKKADPVAPQTPAISAQSPQQSPQAQQQGQTPPGVPPGRNMAMAGASDEGDDNDSGVGGTPNAKPAQKPSNNLKVNAGGASSPMQVPNVNINKLEYDGMIPLEPDLCVPYVHDGELAYIKVENIKLEGNTESRPAKGFWLACDPTYSPYIGNSVLPSAWLFWRAKIGMPDSAVEVLLKANYKAAFSGLQVKYPSETIIDDDGTEYDPRAEAEWYAENIKAGTNVVLPSEVDENKNPKWHISSYGGQPVDIEKMLPMMDWLSKQINRGMGIPDEIIMHDGNTGGYGRSSIALKMFMMLALRRARHIARTFDDHVCKPLMKKNGGKGDYKVVVTIPGMDDDDPDSPSEDGAPGSGGDAEQLDGMGGDEQGGTPKDQSDSPLTSLFQKTMGGDDSGGGNNSSDTNMSLSNFLNQIVSEATISVPPAPVTE